MESEYNPLEQITIKEVEEALEVQPPVVVHVEQGYDVEIPHELAEAVGRLAVLRSLPSDSVRDNINRIPVRDEVLDSIEKLTPEQIEFLRSGDTADLMDEVEAHGVKLRAKRDGDILRMKRKKRR